MVALDSQGVIARIQRLAQEKPQPWLEEQLKPLKPLKTLMNESARTLIR